MLALGNIAVFCLLVGWFVIRRNREVSRANQQRDEERNKANFMTSMVEDSRDGIVVQDMNARVLWANSSWCQMFGHKLDDILGKNPMSFVIPERDRRSDADIEAFRYDLTTGFQDEIEIVRNVRKDGSELWTALSFTYHCLGPGEDRIVVICRDVTEDVEREEKLKQTNEMIAFRADHDPLTAVANREKFARVFEETRKEACKTGRVFGLMHIDLDHFKAVNDTYGHAAGDAVIMKTADRMRALLGQSDLLARIGGDEFVIICADRGDFKELEALATELIARVCQPVIWEDRIMRIGASVGIAISNDDTSDHISMLQKADVALYEAKNRGRGQVACYDHEMDKGQLDKTRLATELVEALEKGKLDVYLQPQYSLIARAVTGFEALIRWHHPKKGLLLPRDFLPIAAEIGIIDDIDRYAATRAFEAIKALEDAGHVGFQIAVNMSQASMASSGYVDFLKWEADKNNLDPAKISIEVLESTFLSDNAEQSGRAIGALSDAGFRVELDDFGTGYAGLAHLGRLKVDGVKIDKSMTRGLSDNVTNQIIIQAMVGLCSDLGLQVVAEGVIDPTDAILLRQFGCINVQGDGISPPLPISAVKGWLETTDMSTMLAKATGHQTILKAAIS